MHCTAWMSLAGGNRLFSLRGVVNATRSLWIWPGRAKACKSCVAPASISLRDLLSFSSSPTSHTQSDTFVPNATTQAIVQTEGTAKMLCKTSLTWCIMLFLSQSHNYDHRSDANKANLFPSTSHMHARPPTPPLSTMPNPLCRP